jgi:hypothetical protein
MPSRPHWKADERVPALLLKLPKSLTGKCPFGQTQMSYTVSHGIR